MSLNPRYTGFEAKVQEKTVDMTDCRLLVVADLEYLLCEFLTAQATGEFVHLLTAAYSNQCPWPEAHAIHLAIDALVMTEKGQEVEGQVNAESLPPEKRKTFQWILPLEAMSFPLEMHWSISVSEPFLKHKTTKRYLVLNKWELVLLCPERVETFRDYKVIFLFIVR